MRKTALTQFLDTYEDANYYKIEYPEPYIFVHSSHQILNVLLKDADNIANSGITVVLSMTDTDTQASYTLRKITNYEGVATFDIARYIQVMMCDTLKGDATFDYNDAFKLLNCHHLTLSVSALGVTVWTCNDIEMVNGILQLGDKWWTKPKTMKWFVNYPFTFDFRNLDEISLKIDDNNQIVEVIGGVTTTDIYSRMRINPLATTVYDCINKVKISGLGYSFKVAASSDTNNVSCSMMLNNNVRNEVNLYVDRKPYSDDYVYLRWLNNKGELCYYLYDKVACARNTKTDMSYMGSGVDDVSYKDWVKDNPEMRSVIMNEALTVFASFLNKEDYDFQLSLLRAPFVDMLVSWDADLYLALWQRVHIKGGSFTEDLKMVAAREASREVSFTIELPEEKNIVS